ncbi:hypothetical protein GCM10023186_27870 [Hymenobacter koreensis]|uniref:DUF4350 domain-containing protein n=1 Tax=Hymenobacter koreensis TaxID=1084523 RepID=A0ABP8J4K8_9BACT
MELQDDDVRFDNAYYFILKPAGKIAITDIISRQSATLRVYPNEPTFTYTTTNAAAISDSRVANSDLVLLQELPRINAGLRTQLVQFVRRGGKLVITPAADGAAKSDYQQLFADLGLATVRFQVKATPMEPRELAIPSRQHPFFRDVFAEQTRQPDMPKAVPLLTWSRATTDIMTFRDGEAFLSGFSSGRGTVYVFAAPFNASYSTFQDNALFVPVLYRLATMSYEAMHAPAYRLTERAIEFQQGREEEGREAVYKLVSDSATYVPTQQQQGGQLVLQVPTAMQQAGFYALTLNDKPVTTLAFNLDKRESELACYSLAELQQMTAGRSNLHVYDASNAQTLAAQFQQQSIGTSLWRYCLALALLGLLGEVLVLRFGRQQTQAKEAVAA